MQMIALMDCNNFFVSCERLFRPDLLKKPVLVLSSNDGCVVSRSQEVKDLGIGMGVPYFHIKDQCKKEGITVFSSNFTLYRDISSRVMTALRNEGFLMHVYSVDEAFFEVPEDFSEELLHALRDRVMQKTGIPVSIGVGKTKTLAKVAGDFAKKSDGVHVLSDTQWRIVQNELPCSAIWGIGRQTATVLGNAQIHSVGDLLTSDRALIRSTLGVLGERLLLELSGVSVYGLDTEPEALQVSYTSSRSFGTVVTDRATILHALTYHTSHIAEKLRRDGSVTGRLTVIARGSRYGDFSHRESSMTVDIIPKTNDTFKLMRAVRKLLDTLYDSEIPYKKAGVIMSQIQPESTTEATLFSEGKEETRTQKLSELADALNQKFGRGTLRHGTEMGSTKWHACGYLKSPEYTTKWTEIPSVRIV